MDPERIAPFIVPDLVAGKELPRSQLGVDDLESVAERVGTTIVLLITAPLLGALGLVVWNHLEGIAREVAFYTVAFFGVFWLTLLFYLWWKPRWLRRVYLAAERTVLLLIRLFVILLLVGVLVLVVGSLIVLGPGR